MKRRITSWFHQFRERQPSRRMMATALLAVMLLTMILAACQSSPSPAVQEDNARDLQAFVELYANFGVPMDTVIANRFPQETVFDANTQTSGSSDYRIAEPITLLNNEAQLVVGFHNDRLVSLQLHYDQWQTAFDVSKALYAYLSDRLGTSANMPNHPNSLERLTTLPDYSSSALPIEYSEQWPVTLTPQISEALFKEQPYPPHLMLRLALLEDSKAVITVRYVAERSSLQP